VNVSAPRALAPSSTARCAQSACPVVLRVLIPPATGVKRNKNGQGISVMESGPGSRHTSSFSLSYHPFASQSFFFFFFRCFSSFPMLLTLT